MSYVSDWSYVRSCVIASSIGGGILGGLVGVSRLSSGFRYGVVAALQTAVFSGSFFVIREGYRHMLRVSSWDQDWFAINVFSSATGAACVGAIRLGWTRPVVIRSMGAGVVLGMLGSAVYIGADTWARTRGRELVIKSRVEEGKEDHNDDKDKFYLPKWVPFRLMTPEEAEAQKRKM